MDPASNVIAPLYLPTDAWSRGSSHMRCPIGLQARGAEWDARPHSRLDPPGTASRETVMAGRRSAKGRASAGGQEECGD